MLFLSVNLIMEKAIVHLPVIIKEIGKPSSMSIQQVLDYIEKYLEIFGNTEEEWKKAVSEKCPKELLDLCDRLSKSEVVRDYHIRYLYNIPIETIMSCSVPGSKYMKIIKLACFIPLQHMKNAIEECRRIHIEPGLISYRW